MNFFDHRFEQALAGFFPKPKDDTPVRKIGIDFKRVSTGPVYSERLPYEYTSDTNLRTALSILRDLKGDDLVYMLRDTNPNHDGPYIDVTFEVITIKG